MSAHPHWEYRLATSATRRNLVHLSHEWDKTMNLVYNRPGKFECTMDIDSEAAARVVKFSTCIIAERNGVPVWSGPVVNIVDDVSSNPAQRDTTKITAMGWLELLNRRFVQPEDESSLIFNTGTLTGGEIMRELVEQMNARLDSSSNQVPTLLTVGVLLDTQTRKRVYKRDVSFGSAILELSDIENGFDIFVDPMTLTITTRPPDAFADRRGIHFGIGKNVQPANLLACSRTEDGSAQINSLTVRGAGSRKVIVDDPDNIAELHVMLEDQVSLSDVTDTTIITAYGVAELAYRLNGAIQLSVTPSTLPETDTTYRLFDDFQLGDMIYLSANRGRMQYQNHPMRVFATTLSEDSEGNEIMSELQITAA